MDTPRPTPPGIEQVPSADELERAIASVTGVTEAEVSRASNGRDRLRISLAPGEDPEAVAWSVAATLRERFGIALDPAAISARAIADPSQEPVRVISRVEPASGGRASSAGPPPAHADEPLPTAPAEGPTGAQYEDLAAAANEVVDHQHAAAQVPAAVDEEPVAVDEEPARAADEESARTAEPVRAEESASDATARSAVTTAGRNHEDAGPRGGHPSAELIAAARAALAVGEALGSARRNRAAISELTTLPDGDDLDITATLSISGREASGTARGLRTRRGRWRAISEATLDALGPLSAERVRGHVDHVTVLAFSDLAHVSVSVTLLTDRGEETFLGAALVRDDPDRAVMRATLDAINRRVEPWLAAAGTDLSDVG